jgi:hypothetical protein
VNVILVYCSFLGQTHRKAQGVLGFSHPLLLGVITGRSPSSDLGLTKLFDLYLHRPPDRIDVLIGKLNF